MLSLVNDTGLVISKTKNNNWLDNDGLFPDLITTTSTPPNNSHLEALPLPQTSLIMPILFCVISFIGLIANGLVMFVILANKEITKSVANIYIFSLAVADTLFLFSLPFKSTQLILLYWPFGAGMCKIIDTVKYLNYFASVFFLTAMSVDRYVAVVYVVRSNKWRTSRNTYIVCGIIWLVSFAMSLPILLNLHMIADACILTFDLEERLRPSVGKDDYIDLYKELFGEEYSSQAEYFYENKLLFGRNSTGSGEGSGNKTDLDLFYDSLHFEVSTEDFIDLCQNDDSKALHVYQIVSFVIGFVIPFFVITACYVMIIARIGKPIELRTTSKQAERTRRKVTRMVVALVITFFICWCPFYIWTLVEIKGIYIYSEVCRNVKDFTMCLAFANSCLNPILYSFMQHDFCERLRKSIAISFRSLSPSNFTSNHTVSRGDSKTAQKKTEKIKMELIDTPTANKISPALTQVQEQPMPSTAVSCNNSIEKLAEDNVDE